MTESAALKTRQTACQSSPGLDGQLHNLHYREIRPNDWHRLQLFHERLSDLTVELRFHAAVKALSGPFAHHLTELDGKNEAAFVATTGTRGRIVGVARYSCLNPTVAEVAFVVEDGFQGHGVGHHLMQCLKEKALQSGISEFVAYVQPENFAMLRLLNQAGKTEMSQRLGECEVRVELSASTGTLASRAGAQP